MIITVCTDSCYFTNLIEFAVRLALFLPRLKTNSKFEDGQFHHSGVTVVFYHCHSKIKFHPLKATVQIPHVWEWRSSNETTTTAFQAFPVELLVFMDGSSRTSSTPSCSPDPNHVHLAPWLQGRPDPRNSTSGNGTSMKAMENVQCHAMSMARPKPAHEKIQQTWTFTWL